MVMDVVQTVVAPGETIDVIVTNQGVAVNPQRVDLIENLKHSGRLPLMSIHQLRKLAYELGGKPESISLGEEIVRAIHGDEPRRKRS